MSRSFPLFGANPAPTALLPDGTIIYLPDVFHKFVITATPVDDTVTNEQTGRIITERLGLRISASIEYNHVNSAIIAGVEVPGFVAFGRLQEVSSFQFSKTGRNPFIEMRTTGALELSRIQAHVPEGVKAVFESLELYDSLVNLELLWAS